MLRLRSLSSLSFVVVAAGCGAGELSITTYGEDFIEQGIPAADFADGGAVVFDTFLVSFADLAVDGADGAVGGAVSGPVVFDVHEAGPVEVARFTELPARRYEDITVSVVPATTAAENGNADDEAFAAMTAAGQSVFVSGTMTHDGVDKTFAWGFDTATRYVDCELEDGSLGVIVPSGDVGEWQLTIHGDHLFYDDLASEEAVLRLQAIVAADENDDGAVDLAELDAVDLTALPADQYGTGGAGDVVTLGDFVTALTRTLVHHTGEGECTAQKR